MKKIYFLRYVFPLLFMFLCGRVMAQAGSITGRITDESNLPLPGATVTVKGTTNSASADANAGSSCGRGMLLRVASEKSSAGVRAPSRWMWCSHLGSFWRRGWRGERHILGGGNGHTLPETSRLAANRGAGEGEQGNRGGRHPGNRRRCVVSVR